MVIRLGAVCNDAVELMPAKPATQDVPLVLFSVSAGYVIVVVVPDVDAEFPGNTLPVLERYTWQTTLVALVHVPILVPAPVATKYPALTLHEVPSGAAICVAPDGSVGFVVEPSRYAKTTIKSPT